MSDRKNGALDKPKSMVSNDNYRENWEKIFGSKKLQEGVRELPLQTQGEEATCEKQ